MIEVLIVIAVVILFRMQAKIQGLKPSNWGWIGGLSFFMPKFLMGFVGIDILANAGLLAIQDDVTFAIYSILINYAVGFVCCAIAYITLKNSKPDTTTRDEDILDAGLD
ncbi:MAG: hypothetical protein MI974_21065 [Chitinophagales bacterium]|nr:hypothetical protein [Chitinophagales bacterium]